MLALSLVHAHVESCLTQRRLRRVCRFERLRHGKPLATCFQTRRWFESWKHWALRVKRYAVSFSRRLHSPDDPILLF